MSPPWISKPEIPAVKSLMRVFPQAVDVDETIAVARRMMKEHQVRYLPIRDGARLVGLLSATDLPRDHALEARVADFMTRDPLIVDLNQPVDEVLMELSRRNLEAALVTRGELLAGILTALDACRAFARLLRDRAGAVDEDDGVA